MGQGPAAPVPPIFHVPRPPNPHFGGREAALTDLRAALTSGQPRARVRALTGLGGVGKSQLAAEYAYRYRQEYAVVWWVPADQPSPLAAAYAALADPLGLPVQSSADLTAPVQAIRRWLEWHAGWLLIFDDAEEPAAVADYLPPAGGGHVLITSRNPAWGRRARPQVIDPLPPEAAAIFLLERIGQGDREAAVALAKELGGLPLALELAAAYIEKTGHSSASYLTLFRSHAEALWHRDSPPPDYPHTLATTWELSFRQVQQRSPLAAELLSLCAFLAPEDIFPTLLREAKHLPSAFGTAVADELQYDAAVAALRRYSLVRGGGDAPLAVHNLVQTAARYHLTEDERQTWAAVAVGLLRDAFPTQHDPDSDPRTWPACARLLPHALTAAGHAAQLGTALQVTTELMNQISIYLNRRGQYGEARAHFERALAIRERYLGPDHPDVAQILNNLADVLREQGDYPAARPLHQRALAIRERALGPDHPAVAESLNNLGILLHDQGEYAAARPLHERALAIRERALGPDHPAVATGLNNLATLLRDQGDLSAARPHFERALAISEKALGPDHPYVAVDLNNLANLLRELGDAAAARPLHERSLTIRERALGPDHPDVAASLHNLANLLRHQGDHAGARPLYERALAIRERYLGPDHPHVAASLNSLAILLREQGDYAAARLLYERALAIREGALGPDHPEVAVSLNNLAALLRVQGDYAGARPLYERALAIDEQVLGPDHPRTQTVRANLARLDPAAT